jgi:hypothetical protein
MAMRPTRRISGDAAAFADLAVVASDGGGGLLARGERAVFETVLASPAIPVSRLPER